MKMNKRILSVLSAAVICTSFAACGEKEDKGKIVVPILETNEESYNTAVVEIGNITKSYTVKGEYSYPYASYISVEKGGVVKGVYFDPEEGVEAGQLLVEFDTSDFDEQIEAAEERASQAEDNLNSLKNRGASQAEIDVAQVDFELENNNLEKLNAQLDRYKIYAPIDGYIELDGDIEQYKEGNVVEDGKYFGRIIDRSEKKLTASVFGQKLENVEYGTRVFIKQGAVAESEGMVSDIIFRENGDFSTYEYVVDVNDSEDFFDFGEISLNFSVYEKDNVVIVPEEAVTNVGKRTFVYTIVDGIRIETDVELGITDELTGMVEITGGLSGGETIVI